jgi:ABC-type multidrug transport system fused ATPase/permease subunit
MANNRSLGTRLREMIDGLRCGIFLMTARERRKAVVLLFSSLFSAFLQTTVLVSIIPMVMLMINPSNVPTGRAFVWLEPLLSGVDQKTILLQLAGVIVGLILFKAIFSWFHIGWIARFSAGCEVRLSALLMRRILTAHYAWLVRQNSARLRQHVFGFVADWSRQYIRSLLRLLNDLMLAAVIVVVLVWANPLAGLMVTAAVTVFSVLIFIFVRPEILRIAAVKRRSILKAQVITSEAILGVKEVKMAGAEDHFSALFDDQITLYAYGDARSQQWVQIPRIVLEVIAYGALIGLGVYVILTGIQSADFTALLLLYGLASLRLMPIFSTVVSGLATLMGSFPIIRDLQELIDATQATEAAPPQETVNRPWREIRLNDATMRYQGAERPAVHGISLTIEPGRSYGVVGPSGAGKSTAIDLIAGLLGPTQGSVSVDGETLVADSRRAWRRRFGYVTQQPFLLDASLRENIIFRTAEAGCEDTDKLNRAVALARLDQVVARLPKGLSSRLGERGALLSGGERQRVVIARALYRGADILILDEATSSLDTLVEQQIVQSIAALRGKITTIIVSHRLNLVRNCDEIWVLDDARLIARGTHDELMEESDLYRHMLIPTEELVAS